MPQIEKSAAKENVHHLAKVYEMKRIAFFGGMLILCIFAYLYLRKNQIREDTRQLFRDVSLVVLVDGHSTLGGATVETHPDDDVHTIKEGLRSGIAEVEMAESFFGRYYYLVRTSNNVDLVFTLTRSPGQSESVLVETRHMATVKHGANNSDSR